MAVLDSMPIDLPTQDVALAALIDYEPERYWAIWQHPEARYAYSVGFRRDAWMILVGSEEEGRRCLLADARDNGRAASEYRLDELTLPDAFAAARAQSLPFLTSFGTTVRRVLGVEVRTRGASGTEGIRRIPL